jgi:ferredoxin
MVKIKIDRDGCISCGACWASCSNVYKQNAEDAKSQIVEQFQTEGKLAEGSVTEDFAECARQGADICPVQVISVE